MSVYIDISDTKTGFKDVRIRKVKKAICKTNEDLTIITANSGAINNSKLHAAFVITE